MNKLLNDIYQQLKYNKKVSNQSDLAKKLGYNRSYVSEIMNSEGELPEKLRLKLSSVFNVNPKFFDNPNAPIFSSQDPSDPYHIQRFKNKLQEGKKRVPMVGEAVAGTQELMNTDPQHVEQWIDVGDLLRDSEAAFTVYGNSMTPNYPPGCVLGLRRNYDGFIQPGEVYVVETKSNRIFKRLFWNDEKTGYICYSDNTAVYETGPRKGKYYYEPFELIIKGDEVRIFDVTGMIKRNRNSAIMQRVL